MGTERPARRGYQRLEAVSAGAGAIERLWATHAQLQESDCHRVVGQVSAVFDRTMHLALPTADSNLTGRMVAFGTADLRHGPLLIQVDTPGGFSFRSLGCDRGTDCVVSSVKSNKHGPILTCQFPHGSAVDMDRDLISVLPDPHGRELQFSLEQFGFEGHIVSAHQQLIRWLSDQDESAGLGFLSQLAAYHQGDSTKDLEEILRTLVTMLTGEMVFQPHIKSTDSRGEATNMDGLQSEMGCLINLLGRGPGATPSGDDYLSGLLLILLNVSEGRIQHRAQSMGQILLSAANGRTTDISRELLTEACKRRGSRPAIRCLRALARPEVSCTQRRDRAQDLIEIGHTSGLDLLTGMLTGTSAVLPLIATRTEQ